MPASVTGDDEAAGHVFTDVDGDLHQNGASFFGAETSEGAEVKGVYNSGTISVTVPSIGTAGLGGTVAVDVSATDTITVNFQAIGGTVTGAAKNFNFLILDLT